MKIKFIAIAIASTFIFTSCGDGKKKENKSIENVNEEVQAEPVKEEVPTTSEEIDLTAPTLDDKGVGPIKEIKLKTIDEKLVAKGKEAFKASGCTACHKFKKRFVGPGLKGVTERRSPEWIMNMILNPEEMVEKDPVAKALLTEYNAPMANQNVKEEDARAILEYFRTKN